MLPSGRGCRSFFDMGYDVVVKNTAGKYILIALAWPYANGSLHLGHIASFIGADVLARYHRLRGDAVLFVSGSDCYGTPIVVEAIRRGVSPASIADRYHAEFEKNLLVDLSFSHDLYTKTTTPEHTKVVQDIFLRLYEKGFIYPKVDRALYSPALNRFLPDRFVEGECPHCGYADARGDQCDSCGALLSPLDLRNPRANRKILEGVSMENTALEVRESEHFYLKLSAFQGELERWVGRVSGAWRSNAAQFTESFLKQGLQDRAITRDTDWGVPVPLPGYGEKRIYVWFDAVLGYLSASHHVAAMRGASDSWKRWWENPEAVHYYVHGKDNVVFHTLILPAILTGAGGFHLPDRVFASEYLSLEGKQFSTSRSHAVWVPDFLQHFDSELLRYFLIAQGPETSDVDFRWSAFGQMVNGEIIGTFGNLVHRACTFAETHFPDGVSARVPFDSDAERLLGATERAFGSVGSYIKEGKFRQAFREILKVAELGNQFLHGKEPWKTVKDTPERAQTDMLVVLHSIHSLALVIQPFLPKTSVAIRSFFGEGDSVSGGGAAASDGGEGVVSGGGKAALDGAAEVSDGEVGAASGSGGGAVGASDGEAAVSGENVWVYRPVPDSIRIAGTRPLFTKVEEADIQAQREKLGL